MEEKKNNEPKIHIKSLLLGMGIVVAVVVAFAIGVGVTQSRADRRAAALQAEQSVSEADVTASEGTDKTNTSESTNAGTKAQSASSADGATDSASAGQKNPTKKENAPAPDASSSADASTSTDASAPADAGNTPSEPATMTAQSVAVTEDEALAIAYEAAGVNATSARWVHSHIDYDDGFQHYDISFVVDTTEYDFEIDAETGMILEQDIDSVYD